MSPRIERLARLIGTGALIQVNRKPIDPHKLLGFVVGVSEKLLLLHIVDGSTLMLNGYAAIRLKDVRSYSLDKSFVGRVLRLAGRRASIPEGIDLSDWEALTASAGLRYPLITLALEKKEPNTIYIGQETERSPTHISIKRLCTKAKWRRENRYAFKQITMVSFDDGYTNALAHLVKQESQGS